MQRAQGDAGADALLPHMPPAVPRVRPNAFSRWFGRTVLRLGGWRVNGVLPDIPRLVMIGAPHSSNWDGVWGFSAKLALGLDVRVLGKDSLFRVPVLPMYFHYPRRTITFGPLFEPGDDMAADIERLRGWYRTVSKGRNRDV